MIEPCAARCLARLSLLLANGLLTLPTTFAQTPDSTGVRTLPAAVVSAPYHGGVRTMPDTLGAVIMAGKRSEVITLSALDADLSTNQARQVFAKVPGISVWENDGSGVQLGIAARGLSPNRSWEFNLRQNGYDIAADAFGYPEGYYTPPMEALERIEVVRGAASLAYGPQFGGLVNFVMKKGVADRPMALETRVTTGQYGLFDAFNGLGGTKGKWTYYTFLHHRNADGWRANSRYSATTAHASVGYALGRRARVGLEYTRSDVRQQQPGGLTDDALTTDPTGSARGRNWLLLPWNVAAATLDWRPDDRTVVDVKLHGLFADRGSVGFVRTITIPDTVDRSTGAQAPRQVDRDHYLNFGVEARVRRSWKALGREAVLATGIRYYDAHNDRRQRGVGTTAADADLSVTGAYGKSFDLANTNTALFAENLFRLSDRFSLVPGARLEHLRSRVDGRLDTTSTGSVDSGARTRDVLLLGLGAQFKVHATAEAYANFSQAYRPVTYSDLTPSATTDVIDPNLSDASGYNIDAGFRGMWHRALRYDLGVFYLLYDNRIGTLVQDGVNVRTNIGRSVSRGFEGCVEADVLDLFSGRARPSHLVLFLSYAFTDATYQRWSNPAIAEDPLQRIEGKRLEYAPRNTVRSGITYRDRHVSGTLQWSAVDGVFTDAANTVEPNAASTVGWIPGYAVVDVNVGWHANERISLTVGVNNALDERYATRRSGGYPGPGLLPGMGRNGYLTLSATF